jgi:hypothetical protein
MPRSNKLINDAPKPCNSVEFVALWGKIARFIVIEKVCFKIFVKETIPYKISGVTY